MKIILWMHLTITGVLSQIYGQNIASILQDGIEAAINASLATGSDGSTTSDDSTMDKIEVQSDGSLLLVSPAEVAGAHLVELDILEFPEESKEKRAAIRNESLRWPNKTVPYRYVGFHFLYDSLKRANVRNGMDDWSRYTCLQFRESSTSSSAGILQIHKGSRLCSVSQGWKSTGGKLILAPPCFYVKELILHELGHILGLWHEHTRPDRDEFVDILWENIKYAQSQFYKRPQNEVNSRNVSYDYKSIMHFDQRAFGKTCGQRKCTTIRTKDAAFQNIIGQHELSFRDIKVINLLYNCNEDCSAAERAQDCPGEGFVGKDCQCWCPNHFGVYKICPVKESVSCETSGECDPNADCISNKCQCREPYINSGSNCSEVAITFDGFKTFQREYGGLSELSHLYPYPQRYRDDLLNACSRHFGHEWSFAFINSRQEYTNMLEGYKNYNIDSFHIPFPWINGSTNAATLNVLTFDDYIPDNSGDFCVRLGHRGLYIFFCNILEAIPLCEREIIVCERFQECDLHSSCINTTDGYECICDTGFIGDGAYCEEINECTGYSHDCSGNGTCRNTPGSYECQCNAGFNGDGRICLEHNECSDNSHDCSVNATCTNTVGSYECHCNAGFNSDGRACFDHNECTENSHDCSVNAYCNNTVGSYECHCNVGFIGDGRLCLDLDGDGLGFFLNGYSYRKISVNRTHSWINLRNLCTTLGPQWSPVVFNGERQDFLDLGVAHGHLLNIKSFWIYGSTDRPNNKNVKFASYMPDESGARCVFFNTFRMGEYQNDFFRLKALDCEDDSKVDAIMCHKKNGVMEDE